MNEHNSQIFFNGKIHTIDENKRICDAMVVSDGKLLYVGDEATAKCLEVEKPEYIDLQGKTVLPGLGDGHVHASSTCEFLYSFDMYNIGLPYDDKSQEAMNLYKDMIKEAMDGVVLANDKGKSELKSESLVIRGTGWDPGYFMHDTKAMPKASDIDEVCSKLPVILRSYDHHYIWVNSKVLKDANITKDTPSPENGVIWRDEYGNPTGLFQESTAIDLVLESVSYGDYTVEQYENGILHYQSHFGNFYGTTLIFDALASENAIAAYKNLARDNRLTLHVTTVYNTDPTKPLSQIDEIIARKGQDDVGDFFHRDTIKVFVDGTGLSIFMDEPYEKEFLTKTGLNEDYCGYPQWSKEQLKEIIVKANNAGMPVHLHCMGDGATRITLDAMEEAAKDGVDIKENRNTIAHFMAIRDEDKKRMAKLGIIANVQPIWGCYYSMTENIITEMIGDKRARGQYPLGSFKANGVRMAAGTDFPVIIPPSPFLGFKVATTRTINREHPEYETYKNQPLGPLENPLGEALSLEDIIEVYSINTAFQAFYDDIAGSLEKGKCADFIVLDRDIDEIDLEYLDDIKVENVFFGGNRII